MLLQLLYGKLIEKHQLLLQSMF